MAFVYIGVCVVVVAALLSWILITRSRRNHLRVLMYHKISDGHRDYLTVPASEFEKQLQYLTKEGYTTVSLSDIVNYVQGTKDLPARSVLITSDDGYLDNYTRMYSLLETHHMRGCIFLVPAFLNEPGNNPPPQDEYLSVEHLRKMNSDIMEFGLHSYDHKSYKTLSLEEIDADIQRCKQALDNYQVDYQPALAFTYGRYPKKGAKKKAFFEILKKNQIVAAFRIGNRLNPLPLSKPLLIQRLDIRGDDSFEKFKSLLKKGKSII